MSKRNFKWYLEAEKKSVSAKYIKDSVLPNEVRINTCFHNLPAQTSLVNSSIAVTNEITLYPKQIDSNFLENTNYINCDAIIPKIISNKNNVNLKDKLCKLISHYHISHNCVNELLQILRSEGLDLPKDVRTLLKTPKTHEIIDVHPGSYIHIGVDCRVYMVTPILIAYFLK